ncbi:amidohydrolase [Sanguibacter suaedae]|uniref:Amidohydrolase family protein n=1 Tax=Sanguibacter suaedae TaxID=2795737 RepID=A0A934I8K1_9MICO|nr:amidohydrolase family protein [Sanguibacter suaedae]MBI9115112.1 amidohydrolase family protein [Sanguibacter suaedae]
MTTAPHPAAPRLVGSLLLRGARVPGSGAPLDVRVRDGIIVAAAPRLEREENEPFLDAEGRWAVPGLWDQHVHLGQVAKSFNRLDLTTATSAAHALTMLRERIESRPRDPAVEGFGFRAPLWPDRPTLTGLDALAPDVPVVLASNDVHAGWVNTVARRLLDLPLDPPDDDGLVRETVWFDALTRYNRIVDGLAAPGQEMTGYREVLATCAARGVVGVTDMEFHDSTRYWPDRFTAGLTTLRVRAAVYAPGLDDVLALGYTTGQEIPGGGGLLTQGPLKIITDGSLGTRTAHCRDPYPNPGEPDQPHGVQAVPPEELTELLARARAGGLRAAVHALGDAAVDIALDAFETTGTTGSVEHAQLVAPGQGERMARLGVVASVQPAHLLDDRDVTEAIWPGRSARSFPLRDLHDAGVTLTLGSDAPVAPLDPWLAMAAAVHRSADDRDPWHPEQHLTVSEALAASTDGRTGLHPGGPADIVLLDSDPLQPFPTTAETAAHLRGTTVAVTLVAGRVVHDGR